MSKKLQIAPRVLREMLETISDLSAYGLVSAAELARMKALCEVPSKRAGQRADGSGLHGKCEPKSDRRNVKLRDKRLS